MTEAPSPEAALPPPDLAAICDRLFAVSLDLICIAGFDGYFKRVNPSWTRVLGWSEAELLARPVEAFMHPEDRARTLQAREGLRQGIPVCGLENRYLCKDGSYRWLSWQSVTEPGVPLVFAVARDITERRQRDHDRLVMSKLESTGILAGGIAHDFNNLLASLLLSVDLVNSCGPTTAEQDEQLQRIRRTVDAAKALTQQLIAFAEGDLSARRVASLREVLRESLEFALRGADRRSECHIATDLWPCEADQSQLAQVFRGLILNAREATAAGGLVRVDARNVVLAAAPAGLAPGYYVCVTLTDDGAGIPADVLPRIFDPYFSTKQRGVQKGMGLGLTICRAILHRHGGAIAVESRPGRGTAVICHLPASHKLPEARPVPGMPAPGSGPARILVMDDEEIFREILGQTLRQSGYEAVLAGDGEEAVACYERAAAEGRPFALVLLDLTVRGGMSGTKTMQALQARDPAVRAVLMSGYSNEETFRDFARHGFKHALAKPFASQVLRDLIAEILGPAPPAANPGA